MVTGKLKSSYRNIFLVQDRNSWSSCPFSFDKSKDVVLTFDLGVLNEVASQGGESAYIDHMVEQGLMERYNHETYDFFSKWYRDKDGEDILVYKNIGMGNAFRSEIWNDITYSVRIFLNLLLLKSIKYENLFAGLDDTHTLDLLDYLGIKAEKWDLRDKRYKSFYFPLSSRLQKESFRIGLKDSSKLFLIHLLDIFFTAAGTLVFFKDKKEVFIYRYYPTEQIVRRIKADKRLRVILQRYTGTKGFFNERKFPEWGISGFYIGRADGILERFRNNRSATWEIEGTNISNFLYKIIINIVSGSLPDYLKTIDNIFAYFPNRNLKLMVTIANVGKVNCLLLGYCRLAKIPVFDVINGIMLHYFPEEEPIDEAWINCYGESIKENYFLNRKKVICLGDPRLDWYVNNPKSHRIDSKDPAILIGTAAFSPMDLNSYLAFEFDFLNDVMKACSEIRQTGRKMNLILKVRSYGYIGQYRDFLKEYYPDMAVKIYDNSSSFKELLLDVDFYITSQSGTVFEASSLGIPVLYYKKDSEVFQSPFDGESELVTAFSVKDLVQKIELFYENDPIYNAFRDKKIMEKYVGPLDGKNTERNIDFIYSLVFVNNRKNKIGDKNELER